MFSSPAPLLHGHSHTSYRQEEKFLKGNIVAKVCSAEICERDGWSHVAAPLCRGASSNAPVGRAAPSPPQSATNYYSFPFAVKNRLFFAILCKCAACAHDTLKSTRSPAPFTPTFPQPARSCRRSAPTFQRSTRSCRRSAHYSLRSARSSRQSARSRRPCTRTSRRSTLPCHTPARLCIRLARSCRQSARDSDHAATAPREVTRPTMTAADKSRSLELEANARK